MANDETGKKRQDQLTNEFRNLEKADILIRNEMKHNLTKIGKATESIDDIEKKKQRLLEENNQNQKQLPIKENDLKTLTARK